MTPPVHVHPHTNQREPRIMDYYPKNLITALGHAAPWVFAVFTALAAVFILTGSAAASGVDVAPSGLSPVSAVGFGVFGLIVGQLDSGHRPLECGWCVARANRSGALYHFMTPDDTRQAIAIGIVVVAFVGLVLYLNGWVHVGVGLALQALGFAVWFTLGAAKLAHRNRRHCGRCLDRA